MKRSSVRCSQCARVHCLWEKINENQKVPDLLLPAWTIFFERDTRHWTIFNFDYRNICSGLNSSKPVVKLEKFGRVWSSRDFFSVKKGQKKVDQAVALLLLLLPWLRSTWSTYVSLIHVPGMISLNHVLSLSRAHTRTHARSLSLSLSLSLYLARSLSYSLFLSLSLNLNPFGFLLMDKKTFIE